MTFPLLWWKDGIAHVKSSVNAYSLPAPSSTCRHTSHQKGVCKKSLFSHILYNRQNIFNTNNPPCEPYILTIFYQTWVLEVNCFFQTPFHLFRNGLRQRAKKYSPHQPEEGGGEGEKGVGGPHSRFGSHIAHSVQSEPWFIHKVLGQLFATCEFVVYTSRSLRSSPYCLLAIYVFFPALSFW